MGIHAMPIMTITKTKTLQNATIFIGLCLIRMVMKTCSLHIIINYRSLQINDYYRLFIADYSSFSVQNFHCRLPNNALPYQCGFLYYRIADNHSHPF